MDDGQTVQRWQCEVEECHRKIWARRWCEMHYFRWYYTGSVGSSNPKFVRLSLADPSGIEAELLRKFETNDRGCWLWTGTVLKTGYGRRMVNNRPYGVHRLAAWLWKGMDLDSPLQVLHDCDTPRCYNPEHLTIGTNADNMLDMCLKGRKMTKATPAIVRAIRADKKLSHRELGQKYGLAKPTVWSIKTRRTWKHIR